MRGLTRRAAAFLFPGLLQYTRSGLRTTLAPWFASAAGAVGAVVAVHLGMFVLDVAVLWIAYQAVVASVFQCVFRWAGVLERFPPPTERVYRRNRRKCGLALLVASLPPVCALVGMVAAVDATRVESAASLPAMFEGEIVTLAVLGPEEKLERGKLVAFECGNSTDRQPSMNGVSLLGPRLQFGRVVALPGETAFVKADAVCVGDKCFGNRSFGRMLPREETTAERTEAAQAEEVDSPGSPPDVAAEVLGRKLHVIIRPTAGPDAEPEQELVPPALGEQEYLLLPDNRSVGIDGGCPDPVVGRERIVARPDRILFSRQIQRIGARIE